MEKCSVDQYDFVSMSGSKNNNTISWRKNNPDQQKLKDVWFGPDKSKFRPTIKGFYCSCAIDGNEIDKSKKRYLSEKT
jgi:hypothetical protein